MAGRRPSCDDRSRPDPGARAHRGGWADPSATVFDLTRRLHGAEVRCVVVRPSAEILDATTAGYLEQPVGSASLTLSTLGISAAGVRLYDARRTRDYRLRTHPHGRGVGRKCHCCGPRRAGRRAPRTHCSGPPTPSTTTAPAALRRARSAPSRPLATIGPTYRTGHPHCALADASTLEPA
jgi:hypothetical protein